MEIEKKFCSYEQSIALKELGFNEECFGIYIQSIFHFKPIEKQSSMLYAPLKSQAFEFFRSNFNLVHSITFKETKSNKIEGINSVYFDIEIYTLMGGDAYKTYKFEDYSDNYEEAENACIDNLILIVNNKKHE